jgi:hypothetical protein
MLAEAAVRVKLAMNTAGGLRVKRARSSRRLWGKEDAMKHLTTGLMVAMLPLLPGAAWAGSSTDAALALGSFAVLNQIIGGTGLFAGLAPAPPQPVYLAPPQPVYVAPPPPVYVAPPPAVYFVPRPVHVAPRYRYPAPVHYRARHPAPHWKRYHRD